MPFLLRLRTVSPLEPWANISPSALWLSVRVFYTATVKKFMPSITFIIKQLKIAFQLVLLLGKIYPENVLKSLSLRLIFFNNKFSAVAKFLLVSSLPSCFLIGPSADNVVHGALLEAERCVSDDCWQVRPNLSFFRRPSPQFRLQRRLSSLIDMHSKQYCKNVNLGNTHHNHFPLHDFSFDCCLLVEPFLDLDHWPTF